MSSPLLVLSYDIGTTGNKTCLYDLSQGSVRLVATALQEYPLYVLENGGVEQEPDDWWRAMVVTTRKVLAEAGVSADEIRGISFCCQMQGLVLVDRDGKALRRGMSYMDQRGGRQREKGLVHGLKISGLNAPKTLYSLYASGGVSASVKDPLWKYKWVQDSEPAVFSQVHQWLDIKDYLVLRCTGRFCMTEDSAHVTFLYNTRSGRYGWDDRLCRSFGVQRRHLPEVIRCIDQAGGLTERAASDLGLKQGTPVFGGGGDLTCLSLGAGCASPGDTHVYVGTSGWVCAVVSRRMVDLQHYMASILGAIPGCYNYIGEQETSGKCLEWVRDHLALDEIGIYLEKRDVSEGPEAKVRVLLDHLSDVVSQTPAGAGGVLFTPWLHGNRSPFEDPNARGMFFNISLETGKRHLIRAVVEGLAFHKRWILECMEHRGLVQGPLRMVGGGALSDALCQVMADVSGRRCEAVDHPQNAGASGAAVLVGLGLSVLKIGPETRASVPIRKTFEPDSSLSSVYGRNFQVFKRLYRDNKESFRMMKE